MSGTTLVYMYAEVIPIVMPSAKSMAGQAGFLTRLDLLYWTNPQWSNDHKTIASITANYTNSLRSFDRYSLYKTDVQMLPTENRSTGNWMYTKTLLTRDTTGMKGTAWDAIETMMSSINDFPRFSKTAYKVGGQSCSNSAAIISNNGRCDTAWSKPVYNQYHDSFSSYFSEKKYSYHSDWFTVDYGYELWFTNIDNFFWNQEKKLSPDPYHTFRLTLDSSQTVPSTSAGFTFHIKTFDVPNAQFDTFNMNFQPVSEGGGIPIFWGVMGGTDKNALTPQAIMLPVARTQTNHLQGLWSETNIKLTIPDGNSAFIFPSAYHDWLSMKSVSAEAPNAPLIPLKYAV